MKILRFFLISFIALSIFLPQTVFAIGEIVDHGKLKGLSKDDHPQYVLRTGRDGATNDIQISTETSGTISGSDDAAGVLALQGSSSTTDPGVIKFSPNATAMPNIWVPIEQDFNGLSMEGDQFLVGFGMGMDATATEDIITMPDHTAPGRYIYGFYDKRSFTQSTGIGGEGGGDSSIEFPDVAGGSSFYAGLKFKSNTGSAFNLVTWDTFNDQTSFQDNGGDVNHHDSYHSFNSSPNFASNFLAGEISSFRSQPRNVGGASSMIVNGLMFTQSLINNANVSVRVVNSDVSAATGANYRFLYQSGTAPSVMVGGLRIGDTTAPTQKLEVMGNIKVDNDGATQYGIRFDEASGDHFRALKAPSTLAGDKTFLLPDTGTDGVELVATDSTAELTGKTINSGVATTTHAITNYQQILRTTSTYTCQGMLDGKDGELCYEQDTDTLYACEPTAGDCNTAAEWRQIGGGVSDHGALTGLGDDDHAQYALLAGRTGTTNDVTISTSGTQGGTVRGSDDANAPLNLNTGTATAPGAISLLPFVTDFGADRAAVVLYPTAAAFSESLTLLGVGKSPDLSLVSEFTYTGDSITDFLVFYGANGFIFTPTSSTTTLGAVRGVDFDIAIEGGASANSTVNEISGFRDSPSVTAGASGTVVVPVVSSVDSGLSIGAGATVNNRYGLRFESTGGSGSATNAVGMLCGDDPTNVDNLRCISSAINDGAGTTRFFLRSTGTAPSVHTGTFRIGDTTVATEKLEVLGNILVDNASTANSIKFRENSGNGANFRGLKAPATLGDDKTYLLPDTGTDGVELVATDSTQTLANKTINGGVATTVHAANANFVSLMRHATDCTAVTDGVAGEPCYELDSDTIYVCETADTCDTAGEWKATGGTPDLSGYLLLTGRPTTTNDPTISTGDTGTIYGSSASAGSLVLFSTSHSTKGGITLADPVTVATSGEHYHHIRLSTDFDNSTAPTGDFWGGIQFQGTITQSATGAHSIKYFIVGDPLSNDQAVYSQSAGSVMSAANGFVYRGTTQSNGATLTSGTNNAFVDEARYNQINSGTISGVLHRSYWTAGPNVGSGITLANAYGLQVSDGAGAGTITNQEAVHCDALAKGTTNACITSAMTASGTARFFLNSTGNAPSALAGGLTLGAASVAPEGAGFLNFAAVAAGNCQSGDYYIQADSGSSKMKLCSNGTLVDPTAPTISVIHHLTWFFPGTPTGGLQVARAVVPEGLTGCALTNAAMVVNTTSASTSSFNIDRCSANCTGTSAATWTEAYTSDVTLPANDQHVLGGTPNTTTIAAGEQFRASVDTVGTGLSDVTITATYTCAN